MPGKGPVFEIEKFSFSPWGHRVISCLFCYFWLPQKLESGSLIELLLGSVRMHFSPVSSRNDESFFSFGERLLGGHRDWGTAASSLCSLEFKHNDYHLCQKRYEALFFQPYFLVTFGVPSGLSGMMLVQWSVHSNIFGYWEMWWGIWFSFPSPSYTPLTSSPA